MSADLIRFITESNAIEGIFREPSHQEVGAHQWLLQLNDVDVTDLDEFVSIVCCHRKKSLLRDKPGMNVRIGKHVPPTGGFKIVHALVNILEMAHGDAVHPYIVHCEYEQLHPFMDGNGRSGRALWLWQQHQRKQRPYAIPFLQWWYYQSLDKYRR